VDFMRARRARIAHGITVWCKPGAPISSVRVGTRVFERVETGSASTENRKVREGELWVDSVALEPGEWNGVLSLPDGMEARQLHRVDVGRSSGVARWRDFRGAGLAAGPTGE